MLSIRCRAVEVRSRSMTAIELSSTVVVPKDFGTMVGLTFKALENVGSVLVA